VQVPANSLQVAVGYVALAPYLSKLNLAHVSDDFDDRRLGPRAGAGHEGHSRERDGEQGSGEKPVMSQIWLIGGYLPAGGLRLDDVEVRNGCTL